MNKGRNTLAIRFLGSHVSGFNGTFVPYYQRFFLGGDFDIRGFDFRQITPIAYVIRNGTVVDPETGNLVTRPFDDVVYVGGDTQGVMNVEYRIPIIGHALLLIFLALNPDLLTSTPKRIIRIMRYRRLRRRKWLQHRHPRHRCRKRLRVNVLN